MGREDGFGFIEDVDIVGGSENSHHLGLVVVFGGNNSVDSSFPGIFRLIVNASPCAREKEEVAGRVEVLNCECRAREQCVI